MRLDTESAPAAREPAPAPVVKSNPYPWWAVRFWHGMSAGSFASLLKRNHFRIHPARIPMAFLIANVALCNSLMNRMQWVLDHKRLAQTSLPEPPVFIIGHWRSGTTMLHELMVRDEQFAYPTTYACFVPQHFLITSWFIPHLFWFCLPSKRPMDNMPVSFQHPQEDEMALLAMGLPSPLARIAFPNEPAPYLEYLNMEGISEGDLEKWKKGLDSFVRALTLKYQKPIVLKSPTHTGRIGVLSQMFPGARFVHIVRDPYTLFASSRRLWMTLDETQGFQLPKNEHLDEFIFTAFEKMYSGFEKQRSQVDPSQLCEVRYEDLIKDPVAELRTIYEHLQLGDFSRVQPQIEAYVRERKDYQPNQHELEPAIVAEIQKRWAGYLARYQYERAAK